MTSQCLIDVPSSGVLVCRALLRPWSFRNLAPGGFPWTSRLGASSSALAIHSQVFTPPQGITRQHRRTAHGLRSVTRIPAPLMGFHSLQRTPAQRSLLTPRLPHPGTLRLQGSSPLDALLSFEPPNHFWLGRSWDSPFRALLLSKIRQHFRAPEPSRRCSNQAVTC